jgi:hypothetical protein
VADAPLVADDTQTVAPVEAPLQTIAAVPVDPPVAAAAESEAVAAPVEAPVIMSEEPVAEEPAAVEVGAEQP